MTKAEFITALADYDDDTEIIIRDVSPPDSTKNYDIGDVFHDDKTDMIIVELGDIVRHG